MRSESGDVNKGTSSAVKVAAVDAQLSLSSDDQSKRQNIFRNIVAIRFKRKKTTMETIEEKFNEDEEALEGESRKIKTDPVGAENIEEGTVSVDLLSPQQTRFIIVMLAICNFFIANGVSLQGPFFPKEAESKGATPIIYASIFAIYELVMLITSLLFGNIVDRFTPNRMSGAGLTMTGFSTAIFGLITYFNDRNFFISFAFVLRIVESLGATAFATSSYSFISTCFPERTATMFATMEMFFGLGVISGPVVGGFLYDLAGFQLPFLLIGGIMFFCGLVLLSEPVRVLFTKGKRQGQRRTSIVEAEVDEENSEISGIEQLPIESQTLLVGINNDQSEIARTTSMNTLESSKVTLWRFLASPIIVIDAFIIITAITLMGFNGATLEPFLRHESISSSTLATSAMFVALGASYAFTAFLWGKACDRWPGKLLWFALAGALSTIIGLLLIGPSPLLGKLFRPNLWTISGCLVLFGVGTAAKQVVGYTHALNYTIQRRKFPANQQTYGYISGIFFSCLSFGGFIGPIIGGCLIERFNYPLASTVMLTLELIVLGILLLLQLCCRTFHL